MKLTAKAAAKPTQLNQTEHNPRAELKVSPHTHSCVSEWVGGAPLWALFTHNICKTSQNLASTAGATATAAAASEAKHFSLWAKCN